MKDRYFRKSAAGLALMLALAAGSLAACNGSAIAFGSTPGVSASVPAVSTRTPAASPSASAQPTASPTISADPATPAPTDTAPAPTVADPQSAYFTNGNVVVDATTYQSPDLYVKITNVSKGGQNYYVADCRVKDVSKLFAAFASGKYSMHGTARTSVMARRTGAVLAVNADFYNARSQGIVIRNGTLYRKTPYYDVAAIFQDGTMKTYDKKQITADQLMAEGCVQAWSFGPMLLDGDGNAIPDAQLKKRAPQNSPANPRTGIGYIEPNHFVIVVVDGRNPAKGRAGMTRVEFAKLFASFGCKSAYNLDGGGSATMVFMGKVLNHPCDKTGERAVSDMLYFGESMVDDATIAMYSK